MVFNTCGASTWAREHVRVGREAYPVEGGAKAHVFLQQWDARVEVSVPGEAVQKLDGVAGSKMECGEVPGVVCVQVTCKALRLHVDCDSVAVLWTLHRRVEQTRVYGTIWAMQPEVRGGCG